MNVLVLNHDYPGFLDWLYERNPGLSDAPYDVQRDARARSLFGTAYFYPRAFRAIGHEAEEFYVNNGHMQRAWAREHTDSADGDRSRGTPLDRLKGRVSGTPVRRLEPLVRSVLGDRFVRPSWFYDVLGAQLEHTAPDVVLNQAVDGISSRFLADMKARLGFLLVGQIAAPIPGWVDVGAYDLLTSALPHFVDRFERRGIPSTYVKLAFDPSVLEGLDSGGSEVPVSFVGSLSTDHTDRIELLEFLAREAPLEIWAPNVDHLPASSPLRECYRGQAWGRDMFEVLARSKVVINTHIDVASRYAANLRLYEATGVGSLLITDRKENLDEIFEPGEEVASYETPEDCLETVRCYLDHENERERIAAAGQERTLEEHTYENRAQELESFFEQHLDRR